MDEYLAGLNLSNVASTSPEEIEEHLTWMWTKRGPLYGKSVSALMLDYAPDFAKLHFRACRYADHGSNTFRSHPDLVIWSCQNLPSYIALGWETGILNEFSALRRFGMAKEQIMEIVMFSQLYVGMRGLGHVYRAVGDFLPAWGPPEEPLATYPEGWAPDPEAFRSGLDLSTRDMTKTDLENLTGWYERTIGYVPGSIAFGLKYHPEFIKVNRAKWEVAIRTLPKQVAPYIMLRMNAVSQNREGLREAALLCKAWGIEKKYILQTLIGVVLYYANFEGFSAPADALEDILESMA